MKIYAAHKIREADAYTIKNEPIASIDLMERAATRIYKWVKKHYSKKHLFRIFCGIGNNGGDGLVLARLLHRAGYDVKVWIVRFSPNSSEDFQINFQRLNETGVEITDIEQTGDIPLIEPGAVVVDAIFGSGLSRPVKGLAAEVIEKLNDQPVERIAIDIASGLFSEDNSTNDGAVFKPHITITLAFPKLAFMFPENDVYTGDRYLIDIGISREFIMKEPTDTFLIDKPLAHLIRKIPGRFDHKGVYGHALIIAGSYGMMGAAVLSAKAAVRSGAGLVSARIPGCGYTVMQTANPEVMVMTDDEERFITAYPPLDKFTSVGIGPGLGRHADTARMLRQLFEKTDVPLIIDADALNLMAADKSLLEAIPKNSILTPHPGEWKRLSGDESKGVEQMNRVRDFAAKHSVYVILKRGITMIAAPDGEVFFNDTGNPGMATGGSGDVLTGMLTGLMAQGYHPKEAAILGVYLHGLAGDKAFKKMGREAVTAGDIVKYIGKAFRKIS